MYDLHEDDLGVIDLMGRYASTHSPGFSNILPIGPIITDISIFPGRAGQTVAAQIMTMAHRIQLPSVRSLHEHLTKS